MGGPPFNLDGLPPEDDAFATEDVWPAVEEDDEEVWPVFDVDCFLGLPFEVDPDGFGFAADFGCIFVGV